MDKTNIYFTNKNNVNEIMRQIIIEDNYNLNIFNEKNIINIIKNIYQNFINEIDYFCLKIDKIYKITKSKNNYKQLFNSYKKLINNLINKIKELYKTNNNICNYGINQHYYQKYVILFKINNKNVNKFYIIPSINIIYDTKSYKLNIVINNKNNSEIYLITPNIISENGKINKKKYLNTLNDISSNDESKNNILKLKNYLKIEFDNFIKLFSNNTHYTL